MSFKILTYSFYLLFFLIPLVWLPINFELFEYPKMMLVYLLSTIIAGCWLLKMIQMGTLAVKRTPLDFPLLLFLSANLISTILSIDTHTSLWGYYSRSNGGLLSIISYTLLYYALVSNFEKADAIKFLKTAVWGGVVVALWAIPEHFGVSPSCLILTGQADAACWVQDVQSRVFATLGQPNWLAAYLAMLIFPALYFALTSSSRFITLTYTLITITFYLAFTFTYSRGATLGLLAALVAFMVALPFQSAFHPRGGKLKLVAAVIAIFLLINLLFGSALTDFKLLSKFAAPSRSLPTLSQATSVGTQLENGGTESGQIRLIVWQGALDIFKHYPLFGSGVETFAYTYYNFRPVTHNLVSEWDFLYNKAHNEYLNYLATTGLAGLLSYLTIILTFLFFSTRFLLGSAHKSPESSTALLDSRLLTLAIVSSYVSYLIQNFFGFSVVIVALFFYLFPALTFLASDSASAKPLSSSKILPAIFHRPLYPRAAKLVILVLSGVIILTLLRYYLADTYFAEGNKASEAGSSGRAYNQLTEAVNLNPGEPYYRSELGYAAAAAAITLEKEDATTSARLVREAQEETQKALNKSPKNVSFHRTAIRTYFSLSMIDKQSTDTTITEFDAAIKLAPTDAKLTYNKALILNQAGRNKEAVEFLLKTVTLKPNYRDAYFTLGEIYRAEKEKIKAVEAMREALKIIPGDKEVLDRLKEWGNEKDI